MEAKLRQPFFGNYPVTFGFGATPDSETIKNQYKNWGLAGHNAIDYGLPEGVEVLATDSGKVIQAGENGDFGISVTVNHNWGESLYAHLKETSVSLDQTVKKGDKIGVSDSTGNAFGPHLHFAIKPIEAKTDNGYLGYIDPSPYFEKEKEPSPENPKEQEVKVVEKIVEKEIVKEVPVEKIVEKEVIREVPKEVIKEVVKEVPRELTDEELKERQREKLNERLKLGRERKKQLREERIEKIYQYVKGHSGTRNEDLRKLVPEVSESTITKYLSILESLGKIKQVGRGRGANYHPT